MSTQMNMPSVEQWEQEFEDLDPQEHMQLIVEIGRDLPPLAESDKTEETRVRGCQSDVWLTADVVPGNPPRLHFRADSNGQMVRGLIVVLLSLVDGKTPAEILALDLEAIFKRLGMTRHFLQLRSNGLASMVRRVRALAQQSQSAA